MNDSFSHILIGLQNQTAAWLLVALVAAVGAFIVGFVGWMLNSTASIVYRTDDRPVPPLVDHPPVTSLRGPATKGFKSQQRTATVVSFESRRIH